MVVKRFGEVLQLVAAGGGLRPGACCVLPALSLSLSGGAGGLRRPLAPPVERTGRFTI